MKDELIGNSVRSRLLSTSNGGQMTLEIIISLFILVMSVSAIIMVFFGNQSVVVDVESNNQGLDMARLELEQARSIGKKDFNALVSSTKIEGIYSKEIVVQSLDSQTKKVTSKVSWQTEFNRPQKIELNTLVTNYTNFVALGGDTGGANPSGDWTNIRTLGSIDLGPGSSATDLDVLNKIVYLSSTASASSKPDLFIANAIDGQNPFIVSSLNTGPGLNTIDVAYNYAYVGNKDVNAQLQIIDVSNSASPVLLTSFKLPGVSGSGAVGNSIFYNSGKIYIGTKQATGPEFQIIDVSNPASPVSLGSKKIGADINSIYVRGNIAYLATSDDTELKVFDVGTPSLIVFLGGFDAPGDSEDGKSLDLVGNNLYLGRIVGGNHSDHPEFHIVDVTNPATIQNLGSKDLAVDLNDLRIREPLAFLATSDSNKEFQVWNVSNKANPTLWSSLNFPQLATGIDYEDNFIYVSIRSNDGLRILTSNP
ncbi:hypothetical protein HY061_02320 [Candidatus Azambacteria bacterium]|nr:hypothetical protein [Candidatus Azambacteria bacterium]